jgi:rhomboid family GlyGly-CTERM serine protease
MKPKHPIEITAFILLLVFFNVPGLVEPSTSALFPSALSNGESWRWFTYPWAHISLYHLILDAVAFLCLYDMLRCNTRTRLFHLLSCIAFSGLFPVLFDPRLDTIGLRGLSGIAHGLIVVTSLEALGSNVKWERTTGLLVLVGVSAKCFLEVATGNVLFVSYHLGDVGLPVPTCHFGGAIGGGLSFWVGSLIARRGKALHLPSHCTNRDLAGREVKKFG